MAHPIFGVMSIYRLPQITQINTDFSMRIHAMPQISGLQASLQDGTDANQLQIEK